jgi:L,D-peptidoglycan transpeptidase YkuD (ErfK/YbiS/YcfS/YnhG family)
MNSGYVFAAIYVFALRGKYGWTPVLTSLSLEKMARKSTGQRRPGSRRSTEIVIRRAGWLGSHGAILRHGQWATRCSIGRTGMAARKREGDGATPIGSMRIVAGYCRRDKAGFVPPNRVLRPIAPVLGWCDQPGHALYNRPVALPFAPSHETMWRHDRQYDYCLVLDWNLCRRSAGRGSAIFLHLRRDDGGPTAGCVAISLSDMRRLVRSGILRRTLRTVA